MKKFIGELRVGDVINARVNKSLYKTPCVVESILFVTQDEDFEFAEMVLSSGLLHKETQTWYTIETVEVLERK